MCLEKSIESNKNDLIKAVREIIKIKSVRDDSTSQPDMPFGKGPAKALKYALDLAKSFGLETKNLDNYAGWAQLGKGDEIIGILVHLDVVPEGNGWKFPPYGGEIHDGKIYGRGAVDNKGPAMAALFALKSLKDSGIKLNKRIRIIFGTDEESGCGCMHYYKKHDEIPNMGFSPDANYPIINGEKGVLTFTFSASFDDRKTSEKKCSISLLKGGHRPNMVPDYAQAHLLGNGKEIINQINNAIEDVPGNFEIEHNEKEIIIKSFGVSAHASTPEQGKNAVMLLVKLLNRTDIEQSQKSFINFLDKSIGLDTTGRGLGVNFSDEISGPLSFNVGMVNMDENKVDVTVNIRYPINCNSDSILNNIKAKIPEQVSIENVFDMKPHYVPEDNPMIKQLKGVYEKITGQKAYCFSIGGGTYARLFKNFVAFGPTFPGKPELAHQKDEYIEIEDLILNLKIYTHVLKELATQ